MKKMILKIEDLEERIAPGLAVAGGLGEADPSVAGTDDNAQFANSTHHVAATAGSVTQAGGIDH